MAIPTLVRQHWIEVLAYLRSNPDDRWIALFPMESLRVVNEFITNGDGAPWQPVPLDTPLTVRGELYCTAHALNPNKVYLMVTSPEGRARLLLPDNVRLYYAPGGEGSNDG